VWYIVAFQVFVKKTDWEIYCLTTTAYGVNVRYIGRTATCCVDSVFVRASMCRRCIRNRIAVRTLHILSEQYYEQRGKLGRTKKRLKLITTTNLGRRTTNFRTDCLHDGWYYRQHCCGLAECRLFRCKVLKYHQPPIKTNMNR